jgi:hypothetical protein
VKGGANISVGWMGKTPPPSPGLKQRANGFFPIGEKKNK